MKYKARFVASVALAGLTAAPAWGQSEPSSTGPSAAAGALRDPAHANDAGVGDIVVTARRRAESLSKVPISVVALTSDAIAQKSIFNENDLQAAVPGLLIKQNGSANAFNYVIRGQTIDTYSSSPPGVLPYTNEAQLVTNSASTFYDLGGVQVLKGPQGTLFGRNTTGGAVLFTTQQPTDKFEGYLKGRYGNYDAYGIEGAINLPVSDAIKLRIAGTKVGGGAYALRLDNYRRYGNLDQYSIRGTLLIEPTAGIKNTTVAQYTKDGGTNAPGLVYHSQYYRCGLGLPASNPLSSSSRSKNGLGYTSVTDCAYTGYAAGAGRQSLASLLTRVGLNPAAAGISDLSDVQGRLGPWRVIGANTTVGHSGASKYVINTTEIDVSSDLKLKNILMFNKSESDEHNDYDGSPFPVIGVAGGSLVPDFTSRFNEISYFKSTKQFSDELQLQGKAFDSRLQYTLGVYYLSQTERILSSSASFDFYPIPGFRLAQTEPKTGDRSFAVFAQGTYPLTDQLHLTGGFRYTWERNRLRQLPGSRYYDCNVTLGPATCPGQPPSQLERTRSSNPSWNVSLDYQLSPTLMVYATTRGSWRSGGFNYTLAPNPIPGSLFGNRFLPEKVKDVEGGVKYNGRDLISVPFSFNVDVYKEWIGNIQRGSIVVSPVGGTSVLVTLNVPRAQIYGAEADFTVRPVEWLNLGGSLVYTHAAFTRNQVSLPGNPTLFFGPYADVPRWSGSAFAEVSKDLGTGMGSLILRGDVFAQSKTYFGNLNSTIVPGTDIAGYHLVNGRLTWDQAFGSSISIAVFARNVFNKRYYTGGNATGYSLGLNAAYGGMPQTYGGEIKVVF